MGNANNKTLSCYGQTRNEVYKRRQDFSQFSLATLTNSWSGRSFISGASQQSAYSVARPWSRVSRRRWKESTLNNPYQIAKATWPVPHIEAIFLPEFSIKGPITELNFEVLSPISHGAFGVVFHVKKVDTQGNYAMKILSKSKIIAESAVQQVKDEAKIQSTCGHNPFIVNCPFYWQSRKQLFIVSDFVCGGELLDLCKVHRSLPENLVQIYSAELALALDFLHNAGVIYRDLKLENVLLDSDGHCQLIDFGLAKWLRHGDRTTTICGTLQYIAPEVLSQEPYGHAVDWWSLGVLTCCMLCGEFPEAVVDLRSSGAAGAAGGAGDVAEAEAEVGAGGSGGVTAGESGPRTSSAAGSPPPALKLCSQAARDGAEAVAEVGAGGGVTAGAPRPRTSSAAGSPPPALERCSPAAQDLVRRLLERDPRRRLRSLHTLQTIAFFFQFSFADVRAKKVRPRDLWPEVPANEPERASDADNGAFQGFDDVAPIYV